MLRRSFLALAGLAPLGIGPANVKPPPKPIGMLIVADRAALTEAVSEVKKYWSIKAFRETFKALFSCKKNFYRVSVRLDCDPASKWTHLATVKPSKRLLDLLAAARAGDFKQQLVIRGAHA